MSIPTVEIVYWHLTFDEEESNSHKFYDAYVIGHEVIFRWGRVGTNGQYKTEEHYSVVQAESVARRTINTKVNNGYIMEMNAVRLSVESNYLDPFDLAYKVEHALKAHAKPVAMSNRFATLTEAANEIAAATSRKATSTLLSSWNALQREWEEIAVEYKHTEAAMQEAEKVITQRLLGI